MYSLERTVATKSIAAFTSLMAVSEHDPLEDGWTVTQNQRTKELIYEGLSGQKSSRVDANRGAALIDCGLHLHAQGSRNIPCPQHEGRGIQAGGNCGRARR